MVRWQYRSRGPAVSAVVLAVAVVAGTGPALAQPHGRTSPLMAGTTAGARPAAEPGPVVEHVDGTYVIKTPHLVSAITPPNGRLSPDGWLLADGKPVSSTTLMADLARRQRAPAPRAATPAPTPTPGHLVTFKTLDRNGSPVAADLFVINPSVPGGDEVDLSTSGRTGTATARLAAGQYAIGAGINTARPDSFTQFARLFRVKANGPNNVVLDARAGEPVDVTVDGQPVHTGVQWIMVNYRGSQAALQLAGGISLHGTKGYVLPVHGKGWDFGVATEFTTKSPSRSYNLAADAQGAVPARPAYHYQTARLAKVRSVLRTTGTKSSGDAIWFPPVTGEYSDFTAGPLPRAATQYLSAGIDYSGWVEYGSPPSFDTGGDIVSDQAFQPGSHTQIWNGAAVGPAFPHRLATRTGDTLTYGEQNLFGSMISGMFTDAGPAHWRHDGSDQRMAGGITLKKGSRTIASERFTPQPFQMPAPLTAHLPSGSAVYTLSVDARRNVTYAHLSTDVTAVWRFRSAHTGRATALPLMAVRYQIPHLNNHNQAAAGSRLPIAVTVSANPGARVRVTKLTVQASSNDGRTWHTVHLRRAGSHWIAPVTSPKHARFISLRATVSATGGATLSQTITRAYAVTG